MQGLSAFRAGCVQKQHWGLLQAEGKTCEDFQDDSHYSASPDSSFSPFNGDSTTSSSLFIDSLTTEDDTKLNPYAEGDGEYKVQNPLPLFTRQVAVGSH